MQLFLANQIALNLQTSQCNSDKVHELEELLQDNEQEQTARYNLTFNSVIQWLMPQNRPYQTTKSRAFILLLFSTHTRITRSCGVTYRQVGSIFSSRNLRRLIPVTPQSYGKSSKASLNLRPRMISPSSQGTLKKLKQITTTS